MASSWPRGKDIAHSVRMRCEGRVAGYSHFFPGVFIEKTGPSKPSDFFYFALQYTF